MQVQGISWLGVRTLEYDDMLRLFRDLMGLAEVMSEDGFVVLTTTNGDLVELFGPQNQYHRHFGSAPVAGFAVADFAAPSVSYEPRDLRWSTFTPIQPVGIGPTFAHLTVTCTRSLDDNSRSAIDGASPLNRCP